MTSETRTNANADLVEKKNLHENTSYWAKTPRISVRHFERLPSQTCDILIVGSGISGALMAEHLCNGGRDVMMVDRRRPVRGSSLDSTAMIQHEIDVPLHVLKRKIGEEKAIRAWQRSRDAVRSLVDLAGKLDLDCSMEPKRTLYLAGDELGPRALRAEARLREVAGIDARLLDRAATGTEFGIDRAASIVSQDSASANPAQLTAGLIRTAQGRGLKVVSPIEITDVLPAGGHVACSTADGQLIIARHVVFCSGYEFLRRLESPKHSIISTWAIAVKPRSAVPSWLPGFLVWEASDPYLYLRMSGDGSIIAGGEDEDSAEAFDDPARLKANTDRIVSKVEALLGVSLYPPHSRWAAPFGNTTTGLPFIGPVPGLQNVYAVMGFGGNGITFSKIAAEVIKAAISGKKDRDADLFSFPA
ncbi:MAG: FAD-binding oxidoreductase [Hoeflea sp.]|uniref:NAD(P)/FAD-dependent oxidoreductase n=1 Tax=Hoeflea sp. TaxID=1940281 RepID=UPI001D550574|nr:FAD-binding oxidoreductase [Hoeflea sp.]MBU4531913.1 FAD-binding oxidoreductase [Alphaproteobacteria bacterium]MBU4546335.1 FAD-binding oxidoreductase [Alphaproteobacteria bacterium]MBU4549464.1 FAD-binding oxidoreductase [Alphaproteobacteria bacterium]MBV1722639.1 FAD-binding oxidoreductase [Hoeflea sp.]MBV1782577.1 FAD-binding oxidoreductase [Hoeflea sp.]